MAIIVPSSEVASTGSKGLDAWAGFCEISDIVQLVHLGQGIDYFEMYKFSFKAGMIKDCRLKIFLFVTVSPVSSEQTFY